MTKIGIIGAMELEVEQLKKEMTVTEVVKKAGMDFFQGTLNDVPVVIVRCGIGKVNAALCVQILADVFWVSHVINTGVAGSLNADLDIGDILISRDALHHDMDAAIFGYQPGEVPQMGFREFKADERMMELAKEACEKVNPDIHVMYGRVVSGDQFISSREVKERLIAQFHGDCAEMEGASIAHGAYLNSLPFVIIRAISDKADDSAEMDYPTFEAAAAKHSAALVKEMIKGLLP
ncbi:5'-methylthioadenosine/adenosylhomocysteine nucleosidase [Acetatifactor aquisgranensis]|uniref:5'-methylthioadenosine/adenosylhomocysteine nucleosidase n=1 Tax=Acetatifactor aquisgranensis TaxID=2941233 RepID=UPI00203CCA8E|nr:5'-methylthioadenosine/adenosylhomocysteine nucleosidase [Acetatifactor aquisgranensis]MCI8542294.1 5'-methylthioadenosine/adenosylhomocysteine nucleosidase [Lachnospiraceae bacterium]MCI9164497.1 5'-methylthioadenosine/adenosylhomocysteine nucleosidase [Oscillospiraceae bacterium]